MDINDQKTFVCILPSIFAFALKYSFKFCGLIIVFKVQLNVLSRSLKDFFWELVMLIYGNLTYLYNQEISLDEILKMKSRFLTGRWF